MTSQELRELHSLGRPPWSAGLTGLGGTELLDWAKYLEEGGSVTPLHFLSMKGDSLWHENSPFTSESYEREARRHGGAMNRSAVINFSRPVMDLSTDMIKLNDSVDPSSSSSSSSFLATTTGTSSSSSSSSSSAAPRRGPSVGIPATIHEEPDVNGHKSLNNKSDNKGDFVIESGVSQKSQQSSSSQELQQVQKSVAKSTSGSSLMNGSSNNNNNNNTTTTTTTTTATKSPSTASTASTASKETKPILVKGTKRTSAGARVSISDQPPEQEETYSKDEYDRPLDPGDGHENLASLFAQNNALMSQEQEQEVKASVDAYRIRGFYIELNQRQEYGLTIEKVSRTDARSPPFTFSEAVLVSGISSDGAVQADGRVKVGDRIVIINGQWILCYSHAKYLLDALKDAPAIDMTITRNEPLPDQPNLHAMDDREMEDAVFEHYGLRLRIDDSEMGWQRAQVMDVLVPRFKAGSAPATSSSTTTTAAAAAAAAAAATSSPQKVLTLGGSGDNNSEDFDEPSFVPSPPHPAHEPQPHSPPNSSPPHPTSTSDSSSTAAVKATRRISALKGTNPKGGRKLSWSEDAPEMSDTWAKDEYERPLDPGEDASSLAELFSRNNKLMSQEQEQEVKAAVENERIRGFYVELKKSSQYGLNIGKISRTDPRSPPFDFSEAVVVTSILGGAFRTDGRVRVNDRIVVINGQWILCFSHAKFLLDALKDAPAIDITIARGEKLPRMPDFASLSDAALEDMAFDHYGLRLKIDADSAMGWSRDQVISTIMGRFSSDPSAPSIDHMIEPPKSLNEEDEENGAGAGGAGAGGDGSDVDDDDAPDAEEEEYRRKNSKSGGSSGGQLTFTSGSSTSAAAAAAETSDGDDEEKENDNSTPGTFTFTKSSSSSSSSSSSTTTKPATTSSSISSSSSSSDKVVKGLLKATPGAKTHSRKVVWSEDPPASEETWHKEDYQRPLDPGDGHESLGSLFAENNTLMTQEQEQEVKESVSKSRLRGFYVELGSNSEYGISIEKIPRFDAKSPDFVFSEAVLVADIAKGGAFDRDGRVKAGDRIIVINGQWILCLSHCKFLLDALKAAPAIDITITRGEELPLRPAFHSMSDADLETAAFENYGLRLRVEDDNPQAWSRDQVIALLVDRFRTDSAGGHSFSMNGQMEAAAEGDDDNDEC